MDRAASENKRREWWNSGLCEYGHLNSTDVEYPWGTGTLVEFESQMVTGHLDGLVGEQRVIPGLPRCAGFLDF